jgi:hypothetical protein
MEFHLVGKAVLVAGGGWRWENHDAAILPRIERNAVRLDFLKTLNSLKF